MILSTSSGANHTSPSTLQHLPQPVQLKFNPSSYQGKDHGAIADLIRRRIGFLLCDASALQLYGRHKYTTATITAIISVYKTSLLLSYP